MQTSICSNICELVNGEFCKLRENSSGQLCIPHGDINGTCDVSCCITSSNYLAVDVRDFILSSGHYNRFEVDSLFGNQSFQKLLESHQTRLRYDEREVHFVFTDATTRTKCLTHSRKVVGIREVVSLMSEMLKTFPLRHTLEGSYWKDISHNVDSMLMHVQKSSMKTGKTYVPRTSLAYMFHQLKSSVTVSNYLGSDNFSNVIIPKTTVSGKSNIRVRYIRDNVLVLVIRDVYASLATIMRGETFCFISGKTLAKHISGLESNQPLLADVQADLQDRESNVFLCVVLVSISLISFVVSQEFCPFSRVLTNKWNFAFVHLHTGSLCCSSMFLVF